MQARDALDGCDHAEHAVVFARVAHRIEVRAQHQTGQGRPFTFVAPDRIARSVETRAHPRVAHPLQDELVGRALLRREVHAGECVGLFRTSGQCVAAFENARGRGEH